LEQLNNLTAQAHNAEKSLELSKSLLQQAREKVPQEHRGVVDMFIGKMKEAEKSGDYSKIMDLHNEVIKESEKCR
jgi:hypothetical protein